LCPAGAGLRHEFRQCAQFHVRGNYSQSLYGRALCRFSCNSLVGQGPIQDLAKGCTLHRGSLHLPRVFYKSHYRPLGKIVASIEPASYQSQYVSKYCAGPVQPGNSTRNEQFRATKNVVYDTGSPLCHTQHNDLGWPAARREAHPAWGQVRGHMGVCRCDRQQNSASAQRQTSPLLQNSDRRLRHCRTARAHSDRRLRHSR